MAEKELGNVSKTITQQDVNVVYGQVYDYLSVQLKLAKDFGKPLRILIADSHYSTNSENSKTSASGRVISSDSDNVIVALCALDAARRLGINDYILETSETNLGIYTDNAKRSKILDNVSFKHYADYADKESIGFRVGDPDAHLANPENILKAFTPEQLQAMEKDENLAEQLINKRVDETSRERESGMVRSLSETPNSSVGVFGADHIPELYKALKKDYYVVPIICSSIEHDYPSLAQAQVREMLSNGQGRQFIVEGKAASSNIGVMDKVKLAAEAYQLSELKYSEPTAPAPKPKTTDEPSRTP
jgi:hypothetical protein